MKLMLLSLWTVVGNGRTLMRHLCVHRKTEMDPIAEYKLLSTRRHLLGSMAGGIGAAALTDLLGSSAATASPIPCLLIPCRSSNLTLHPVQNE